MDAQDLTHAEAAEAFDLLAKEVGPRADVTARLNSDSFLGRSEHLFASIYADGIGGRDSVFYVFGNSYRELLEAVKSEWAERGDVLTAKTIRDMALKIISITADEGSCSELSLCRAFSAGEVKSYGDRACEEATRIAGNGPFLIVRAASEVEAA